MIINNFISEEQKKHRSNSKKAYVRVCVGNCSFCCEHSWSTSVSYFYSYSITWTYVSWIYSNFASTDYCKAKKKRLNLKKKEIDEEDVTVKNVKKLLLAKNVKNESPSLLKVENQKLVSIKELRGSLEKYYDDTGMFCDWFFYTIYKRRP